jgi:TolC family type I secretion outer membrane protein
MHGGFTSLYAQSPPPHLPVFDNMLVQVYQRHPKLESQRDELRILDERVSQANAGYRPNLSANAGFGKQRLKVSGQEWQYGDDRRQSLVATQSLFSGFSTVAQTRAAKERVQAGRAQLLATEQTVFFSAISSWLEVCAKEKILLLNLENMKRIESYRSATQERYKAGDGTTTDIALAESRYGEAESQAALAEAERDAAIAAYERNTDLVAQIADFPTPPDELPLSMQEAVDLAKHNPELARADHLQTAAQHDIDSASSSLWPNVSLRGAMDEERSTAFALGKLRNDSVTLNVSIPLYQGGAEYSRIREAKIAREKSRQDALDTAREIVQRAKTSWANFSASIKVIQASKRSSSAAKQALEGITEEHRDGTRTLTEVLDAQSELLSSQITETQAHKNSRLEAYRLMASVGKLTVEGLHLPVASYNPETHYEDTAGRWVGTSIDSHITPAEEIAQNAPEALEPSAGEAATEAPVLLAPIP